MPYINPKKIYCNKYACLIFALINLSYINKYTKLNYHFLVREMLIDVLRVMINNPFKESFYGKRKKKAINILTTFLISHKSSVKNFIKWIVNHCPKGTC